jgi:hypothetical protein
MRWAGYVACKGEERIVYKVLVGKQKIRDNLEDQGVNGMMGSEWILVRLARGVEWIRLAQDRDRLRAITNAVMNLLVLAPRS